MSYEAASYRTKKALATALKNKMKEKPFSKITVSELIAVCSVNRKTFYYHFKDIYDLLRWLFQEETLKILKQELICKGWFLPSNTYDCGSFVVN